MNFEPKAGAQIMICIFGIKNLLLEVYKIIFNFKKLQLYSMKLLFISCKIVEYGVFLLLFHEFFLLILYGIQMDSYKVHYVLPFKKKK